MFIAMPSRYENGTILFRVSDSRPYREYQKCNGFYSLCVPVNAVTRAVAEGFLNAV